MTTTELPDAKTTEPQAQSPRVRRSFRLPFSPWHLVLIPIAFLLIVPLLWMLITSLETPGEANHFRPDQIPRSRSPFRGYDGHPDGAVPGDDDPGVPDRQVVRRKRLGRPWHRPHRCTDAAQPRDGVRYLLPPAVLPHCPGGVGGGGQGRRDLPDRRAVQDRVAVVAARAVDAGRIDGPDVLERFPVAVDRHHLARPDDDSVGAHLLSGRTFREVATADGSQRDEPAADAAGVHRCAEILRSIGGQHRPEGLTHGASGIL